MVAFKIFRELKHSFGALKGPGAISRGSNRVGPVTASLFGLYLFTLFFSTVEIEEN